VVMVSAHAVELKEGWFDMKNLMKYSAIGMASKALDKMGGGKNAGFKLGLAPGLYHRKKKEDEEKEKAAMGMRKGGKVKAKSKAKPRVTRGDGICRKGKTRGRIC